jgi:ribosome-associated toxin RatA of RatAB toxin-antitoxin module
MDMLIENMFLLGQNSVVKFSKSQQVILSKLGINDFAKLPKAWTWMSNRQDANAVAFSHCLFKKEYPYTSDIYARLLGEKAFRKLENWMFGQEYKR